MPTFKPRKVINNKYAGPCSECGQIVPERQGQIHRAGRDEPWRVRHHPEEWVHPTGPWDRFEPHVRKGTGCPTWREGLPDAV